MKIWNFPTCSPSLLASQAGLTRGFLEQAAGGGAGTMERVRRKEEKMCMIFQSCGAKKGNLQERLTIELRVILGNLICRKKIGEGMQFLILISVFADCLLTQLFSNTLLQVFLNFDFLYFRLLSLLKTQSLF